MLRGRLDFMIDFEDVIGNFKKYENRTFEKCLDQLLHLTVVRHILCSKKS